MAKPKHPTLRSLRQGQTVYCVVDDSFLMGEKKPKYVMKYFMYSHKTPMPPLGQIIEKVPISNIKKAIRLHNISMENWYYSRKTAERAAKL